MKPTLKTTLAIVSIFSATALTVLAVANQSTLITDPSPKPLQLIPLTNQQPTTLISAPKIELVFAIDTTGSMDGLLSAAKEKIWSIASTMGAATPTPEIRIGLVAYRDRGDDYVTKIIPISSDLDSVYASLLELQAAGGGDGPESVNAALYDAVNKMNWSQGKSSYQAIFLVGDAPAHNDYQDDVAFPLSVAVANKRGIIVNTIQAGESQETGKEWQMIAQLGAGDSFQVEQQGNAIAINTPFDDAIANASHTLDNTRLYIGNKAEKIQQANKQAATENLYRDSSSASLARRAKFNLSASGKQNFVGQGELLDSLANKEIELIDISEAELPEEMQSMPAKERNVYVEKKQKQRQEAQRTLMELNQKRDQFIANQLEESDERLSSLDEKLVTTLRKQAEEKGLNYQNKEISY